MNYFTVLPLNSAVYHKNHWLLQYLLPRRFNLISILVYKTPLLFESFARVAEDQRYKFALKLMHFYFAHRRLLNEPAHRNEMLKERLSKGDWIEVGFDWITLTATNEWVLSLHSPPCLGLIMLPSQWIPERERKLTWYLKITGMFTSLGTWLGLGDQSELLKLPSIRNYLNWWKEVEIKYLFLFTTNSNSYSINILFCK